MEKATSLVAERPTQTVVYTYSRLQAPTRAVAASEGSQQTVHKCPNKDLTSKWWGAVGSVGGQSRFKWGQLDTRVPLVAPVL